VLGNEVTTLLNEYKSPGTYSIAFNPAEYNLASGFYYYQLRAGNYFSTKKMIYLK
jgi:hypothetical protein